MRVQIPPSALTAGIPRDYRRGSLRLRIWMSRWEGSMTASRWVRLLPGRPPVMFLLGIAFLIFIAIIFANLAIERSTTQAEHDLAQARVDQLLAQRYRLQYGSGAGSERSTAVVPGVSSVWSGPSGDESHRGPRTACGCGASCRGWPRPSRSPSGSSGGRSYANLDKSWELGRIDLVPRGGAVAARWAHNPKVAGSNPAPAT